MTDPNFLVIGAQKCGTTWLSKNIRKHPEVCAPYVKELHFFSSRLNFKNGITWYQDQFKDCKSKKAIGEFTPNYFWTSADKSEVIENNLILDIPKIINDYYPDIKLIVSLRNPVERAISAYYHQILARRIPPGFGILNARNKLGIFSMGFYDIHLKNWLKYFSRNQFLILIYENDIVVNKQETLKKIYKFLGISENFKSKIYKKKFNRRRSHLYLYINYYFPQISKKLFKILPFLNYIDFPKIKISNSDKIKMKKIFSENINRIESMLEKKTLWIS